MDYTEIIKNMWYIDDGKWLRLDIINVDGKTKLYIDGGLKEIKE